MINEMHSSHNPFNILYPYALPIVGDHMTKSSTFYRCYSYFKSLSSSRDVVEYSNFIVL